MRGIVPRPSARRRAAADHPRPIRAALPRASTALAVASVGLALGIRWSWILAVAGSLVVLALVSGVRASVALARSRRAADEWLLWGAIARPASPLLDWRAHELLAPRLRATLAHTLRRIDAEASGRLLPGPVPLNPHAIAANLGLIERLCERLEDETRPVSVRGMLLVDRLVTEPESPLYSFVASEVLAEALAEALATLDEPVAAAA